MAAAIDRLVAEHDEIARVLKALLAHARSVCGGARADLGFFARVTNFLEHHVAGTHHANEELLFEALCAAGCSPTNSPVSARRLEHAREASLVADLRAAIAAVRAGDFTAEESLAERAVDYVEFSGAHMAREEQALYPRAELLIPPDELAALDESLGAVPGFAALRREAAAIADTNPAWDALSPSIG